MKRTENLTLLGVMTAIIIVMTAIPGLGYIPLGPVNATIIHIPVIVLAIVKGPKLGSIMGAIFGISSLLNNLLRPTVTSFIFINPLISVLPRILIGLIVGHLTKLLIDKKLKYNLDIVIPAAVGSLVNTVGVLGMIYLLYGQQYLEATGNVGKSAFLFIAYIAVTNGLIELIVSTLISTPIVKALLKFSKRR